MKDTNTITEQQKEEILAQFRKQGLRITKQRELIVDILLNHRFECKKAICYYVHQQDPTIGHATVYRMLQVLEQMGKFSVAANLAEHAIDSTVGANSPPNA